MHLLDALALTFFRCFGITQPTPQATRRAVWFLLLLLAGIVCSLIAVLGFVLTHFL